MSNSNMEGAGPSIGLAPSGFQRSSSTETGEHLNHHSSNMKSAPPLPAYGRGYSYPPHHYPSSRPPHPIQSVVTTSFSMDEEREDGSSRQMRGNFRQPDYHFDSREALHHGRSPHGREEVHLAFQPPHHGREPPHHGREPPQYGRELPPIHESNLDSRAPPHDMRRPVRVPASPRGIPNEHSSLIHRSHSAGGPFPSSYRGQGPLKRSFWHHARPAGDDYPGSLPHEFMPPKRSKLSSAGRREYVVTARSHAEEVVPAERYSVGPPPKSPGWFNRALSWEAGREDYYHREPSGSKLYPGSWSRSPPYKEGGAGQHWADAPSIPSPHTRYSTAEGGHYDAGPSWGHARWQHPEDRPWGGPQHRDEADSKHLSPQAQEREDYDADMRRQGTFESGSDGEPPVRFIGGPAPLAPRTLLGTGCAEGDEKGPVRLLALPEDRISLSETLCLVRENIEVFTATLEDVEAPAPGRKHAVLVGQVGLRCIHCRHTKRSSERVKRAICYPSSIKRIYRTVIDMKLDHFLHCKFVPETLKDTLNALKANNTRSTGTTMQYFIRAAATLGMVDGPSGVRLVEKVTQAPLSMSPPATENQPIQSTIGKTTIGSDSNVKEEPAGDLNIRRNNSLSSQSTNSSAVATDDASVPKELFTGKIPLFLPEDKTSLSPLRCFLREQVCAFSATEEDIAVRTPTTFSVSVGQVGIGCVHCLNQPAKLRLNRAVCFPFSIARIYQSVADIQRFHLGECKMVPPETKAKFLELQSQSSKGSKGLATRQYWVTSAKKIGLVDTAQGIRFGRDPSVPEAKSVSLDILAQVASNVTTVNRPLVLPEDKPFIAEFLYIVMEQLQPCRFTEADRNKRRLKDVGCIGVECKHCAGQVDSRKFFWSSVNAVESNFVSVHTHMMECRMIPDPLKEKLGELKTLRKEQTAALKTGSQKAFFSRVWKRLHGKQQKNSKENGSPESRPEETVDAIMESPPASPIKEERDLQIAPETPAPTSPSTDEIMRDKMAIVSV